MEVCISGIAADRKARGKKISPREEFAWLALAWLIGSYEETNIRYHLSADVKLNRFLERQIYSQHVLRIRLSLFWLPGLLASAF